MRSSLNHALHRFSAQRRQLTSERSRWAANGELSRQRTRS
jgi:hypothetical protein